MCRLCLPARREGSLAASRGERTSPDLPRISPGSAPNRSRRSVRRARSCDEPWRDRPTSRRQDPRSGLALDRDDGDLRTPGRWSETVRSSFRALFPNLRRPAQTSSSTPSLAECTRGAYVRLMMNDIKASCQKRLNRIEGQVHGLAKDGRRGQILHRYRYPDLSRAFLASSCRRRNPEGSRRPLRGTRHPQRRQADQRRRSRN